MKSNYLFVALLSLLFISCDKKGNDDNSGQTKTQLITASSWKYDKAGADNDRNGTIDLSFDSSIDPCLKDNSISFSANGTGTVSENAVVCSGAAANTAITWSFANNETVLNLSGGGLFSGQFKVLKLDASQLHIAKDTVYMGFSTSLLLQLKH